MAEIWGAAIAVGGAVIQGVGAQKERKQATKDAKAATRDEAIYGSVLSQFEREQDEHYNAVNRRNKQRGLDEFRKFNTVRQFAPAYAQTTNEGIVVPEKPDINKLLPAVAPKKKKKRGLFDKITDPANLAKEFGGTSYDPLGIFGKG